KRQRARFDLFHIVDHSYAQLAHELPSHRTVITCHDLDTFRCVLEPDRDPRPLWFRTMTKRILDGLRKAAHVIAVSEATRAELVNCRLIEPERITVVHNGVHPSCSSAPDEGADREAARLLNDKADTIWLLNVGSNRPRKRIDILLRIF